MGREAEVQAGKAHVRAGRLKVGGWVAAASQKRQNTLAAKRNIHYLRWSYHRTAGSLQHANNLLHYIVMLPSSPSETLKGMHASILTRLRLLSLLCSRNYPTIHCRCFNLFPVPLHSHPTPSLSACCVLCRSSRQQTQLIPTDNSNKHNLIHFSILSPSFVSRLSSHAAWCVMPGMVGWRSGW